MNYIKFKVNYLNQFQIGGSGNRRSSSICSNILMYLVIIYISISIMNYIKYRVKNITKLNTRQIGGSIDRFSTTADINYNNELFIYKNFFTIEQFNNIKKIVRNIKFKDDERVSARKTLCLNPRKYKELYDIIYKSEQMKSVIKKINPTEYNIPPRFPVEYRIYPKGSKGMRWHQDTSLFSPNALEGVITIQNESPSEFLWMENGTKKGLSPKPNTLALVKPASVLHKVTGTDEGFRTIIKFVIDFKGSKTTSDHTSELSKCPY